MPNNLSSSAIEAMTACETKEVFLTLIKISIDGVESLFFVDDKVPLLHNGQEFLPWAFSVLLPDETAEDNKSCKLQIDNTDMSVYKIIKSSIGKEVTVDFAVVLSSSPNYLERGWFSVVLRNITVTAQSITGDLYDGYTSDRKATSLTYSPNDFPGLFF